MNAFDERLSESVQVNQFVSVTATSELPQMTLKYSMQSNNTVVMLEISCFI